MTNFRFLAPVALALGLAAAPLAHAADSDTGMMKNDTMMKKDTMKKDSMKHDGMMKSGGAMKSSGAMKADPEPK